MKEQSLILNLSHTYPSETLKITKKYMYKHTWCMHSAFLGNSEHSNLNVTLKDKKRTNSNTPCCCPLATASLWMQKMVVERFKRHLQKVLIWSEDLDEAQIKVTPRMWAFNIDKILNTGWDLAVQSTNCKKRAWMCVGPQGAASYASVGELDI